MFTFDSFAIDYYVIFLVPNAYFEMAYISQNRAPLNPVFLTEFSCKHNKEQNYVYYEKTVIE